MNEIIANFFLKSREVISKPKIQAVIKVLLAICFMGLVGSALAGSEDILSGTDTSLITTLNGNGRKYILMVEGLLSLAMYIKTKNLLVLFGIVVVAVFFNIILKVAGAAA